MSDLNALLPGGVHPINLDNTKWYVFPDSDELSTMRPGDTNKILCKDGDIPIVCQKNTGFCTDCVFAQNPDLVDDPMSWCMWRYPVCRRNRLWDVKFVRIDNILGE